MSDVIDNLQIELNTKANKAYAAVDKLVTELDKLTISLSKVDGANLSTLSSGVKDLGTAMQSMSNVKTTDVTRIIKNITKFQTLDNVKLNQVSTALTPLASAMDSLNQVQFDNKSVINIVNALTRLSSANISGLNNVDFGALGRNLNMLIGTLNSAQSVSSNTIQIVNAIARLSNAGYKAQTTSVSLPLLGKNLTLLINSMSNVGMVSDNTIQFASALGVLASAGNRTAQTANNLGLLATELKKFMQVMSTAPTVNANIIQMTQALGNLAANGNRVGGASRGLNSFLGNWGSNASKATKQSLSLARAIGKVYASYWLIFRALGMFRKAINISGALTEVQNVVAHSFGPAMGEVDSQAKNAIYTLGMSELAFKQYASTYQSMANAMGISSKQVKSANDFLVGVTDGYVQSSSKLSDVSLNLTRLAGDVASFYDKDQKDVAEDFQAVMTGMVMPLRKYGLDLTKANLKQWALNNGLNANIETMTQAEKTMLRYQYVMANTTNAQGDFARTATSWNNQVRLLQQNFIRLGAVWGNAGVNMLKPFLMALNKGMDAAIDFSETVVNALGVIFGWKLEIQKATAIDDDLGSGADDLSDGLGSAADNAKKLRQQLQGIDELNVLTTNKDTGKGSGGSAGLDGLGTEGSKTKFNVVENPSLFESDIDTLYKLGDKISTTLRESLEGIDWEEVYQGGRDFGRGFASFLNGLINVDTFGTVGKTVANSLNTAVYTALEFGEEFDFSNAGSAIANGVNNYFTNFDFTALAHTMNVWADGLVNAFTTAIKDISWTDVLAGGLEFLSELELDTVMVIGIGKFILSDKAKKAALKKLGAMLGTEIGAPQIALMAIVGFISFKIGQELSKNKVIKDLTDKLAEWLFDGGDSIKIERAIPVVLTGLTLSFGAATLFGKAVKSLTKATLATEATSSISGMVEGLGTLSIGTALKAAFAVELVITTWIVGTKFGTSLGEVVSELINDQDLAEEYRNFTWKGFVKDYIIDKDDRITWQDLVGADKEFLKDVEKWAQKVRKTIKNVFVKDKTTRILTSEERKEKMKEWLGINFDVSDTELEELIPKTNIVDALVTKPVGQIKSKSDEYKEATKELMASAKQGIDESKDTFNKSVSDVLDTTEKNNFTNTRWRNGGALLNQGVENSVRDNWKNVSNTLNSQIANTRFNGSYWNANSKTLVDGVNSSINSNWNMVNNTLSNKLNASSSYFSTSTWYSGGNRLVTGLKDGASNSSSWGSMNSSINSNLNSLANNNFTIYKWKTSGHNLVAGLQSGIEASWSNNSKDSLINKVTSLALNLTSKLKSAFGIHSPSRLWRDEIGTMLVRGLGIGVEDEESGLLNTIGSMGARVTDKMAESLDYSRPASLLSDTYSVGVKNSMQYEYSMATSVSSDIARGVKDGVYSAQYEQNALLREQNSLLYQILQKKTGITNDEVYDAVVSKNNDVYNRTGYTPLMV